MSQTSIGVSAREFRGRGVLAFLVLAGLAAVPLAANYLVFKPRNVEIAQARQEIASKRARLGGLRELTTRIDELGHEIEMRQSELAILEKRLPDSEGLDGLLKDITRIAQRVDLAVRTVKADKPAAAGSAMEVPLALVLEGEFDAIYEFLLAIEALPRITRIQSMAMTVLGPDPHAPVRRNTGRPYLRTEMNLSVYFAKPSPGVAKLVSVDTGRESP